jgi:hypothetical protein
MTYGNTNRPFDAGGALRPRLMTGATSLANPRPAPTSSASPVATSTALEAGECLYGPGDVAVMIQVDDPAITPSGPA